MVIYGDLRHIFPRCPTFIHKYSEYNGNGGGGELGGKARLWLLSGVNYKVWLMDSALRGYAILISMWLLCGFVYSDLSVDLAWATAISDLWCINISFIVWRQMLEKAVWHFLSYCVIVATLWCSRICICTLFIFLFFNTNVFFAVLFCLWITSNGSPLWQPACVFW